jgi:hypothetical protein
VENSSTWSVKSDIGGNWHLCQDTAPVARFWSHATALAVCDILNVDACGWRLDLAIKTRRNAQT